MLDATESPGLPERRLDRQMLEDPAWEGPFDRYILLAAEAPQVVRGTLTRLRDLLAALVAGRLPAESFPEPPAAASPPRLSRLLETIESLAPRPEASPAIVALRGIDAAEAREIMAYLEGCLEAYSRLAQGALFSFRWVFPGSGEPVPAPLEDLAGRSLECPVREEPLRLVPEASRDRIVSQRPGVALGEAGTAGDGGGSPGHDAPQQADGGGEAWQADAPGLGARLDLPGPLCSHCQAVADRLLKAYNGDWASMIRHVRVYRLALPRSEGREQGGGPADAVAAASGDAGSPSPAALARAANRGLLCLDPDAADPLPVLEALAGSAAAVADSAGGLPDSAPGLPGEDARAEAVETIPSCSDFAVLLMWSGSRDAAGQEMPRSSGRFAECHLPER